MKVTVKECEQIKRERVYPYLGISKENKSIVYFVRKESGICLLAGIKSSNRIGESGDNWAESHFTPFIGEVVLSND